MSGITVNLDDLCHWSLSARHISVFLPRDFEVLKGLVRSALDAVKSARNTHDMRRFLPVLCGIVANLTHLWETCISKSGLRCLGKFDESTQAIVASFTRAMDRAMLGVNDMCVDLFVYFLESPFAASNYPFLRNDRPDADLRLPVVFDADYSLDVIEARMKDAWALFVEQD